jgi:hypothetical protein
MIFGRSIVDPEANDELLVHVDPEDEEEILIPRGAGAGAGAGANNDSVPLISIAVENLQPPIIKNDSSDLKKPTRTDSAIVAQNEAEKLALERWNEAAADEN